MNEYIDCLAHILEHGKHRADRTMTGTLSLFGYQMRFNLEDGFPLVTTKKMAWKAIVSELLWMISGSGNERDLRAILHGSRDSEKTTIWTANAEAPGWFEQGGGIGDLGRIYGVQWRTWATPQGGHIDQLAKLIEGIKKDPRSRRHIITAWNPTDLDHMALPPCHCFAQFYVDEGKLSCQMYQRSVDAFLGLPFNIASYSLLTHLIAQVCNLGVKEFIHVSGDLHLYTDHLEHAKAQIARIPFEKPIVSVNPKIDNIDDFTMDDIILHNYKSHPAIVAPMSV